MGSTGRTLRHPLIAALIALTLFAGGCSGSSTAPSGSLAAPRPAKSSAEQSPTPRPAPSARELAALSIARQALPGRFRQNGLESDLPKDQQQGIDVHALSVMIPDVDPNERARPKHFDPGKTIFSQLATVPPRWESDPCLVEIVTPGGRVVGWLNLERSGSTWELGSSGWSVADTGESARTWEVAERKVTAALGGSVDETAAVGSWLLGRKGSREAGVVAQHLGFSHTNPWPVEGQVYSGEELARWFGSYTL